MLSLVECGGLFRGEVWGGRCLVYELGPMIIVFTCYCSCASLYPELLNDAYYIKCAAELV